MSELDWKPLANQDKHEPPWCDHCNDYCSPSDGSCRCCLEVDLADHKSANEKLGERVFVAENAIANVRDVESLESRIKVALALCEAWDDNAADAIEAALRGESA